MPATQPNPYAISPVAIASPYTTSAYTTPNGYANSAALQQGQIIPYTAPSNGIFLSPSQLQQLGITIPQTSSATVQPYAYSTATPVVPSVPKVGTTVVTPTAAAYYSAAPVSQSYQPSYQQAPTFRKNLFRREKKFRIIPQNS